MEVKALIFDQLEADGTLRTLRMLSESDRPLVVAFPDEYDEPRAGPFHFLDDEDERVYDRSFADVSVHKVGPRKFHQDGKHVVFETSWTGIPTDPQQLTYYVLMLPEFAVPTLVQFIDPHSGREYTKTVIRDDQRQRFNIYLSLRSKKGVFDFVLKTEFEIDPDHFIKASYSDETNDADGWRISYHGWLDQEQEARVNNFFSGDQVRGNKTTFRDVIGSNVYVNSSLEHAVQTIGTAEGISGTEKLELSKLVSDLKEELQKLSAAQKDDAEAIAQYVKGLMDEATKMPPNKTTVKISAEGLKAAAANLASVMPSVLTISLAIVKVISTITGVPVP